MTFLAMSMFSFNQGLWPVTRPDRRRGESTTRFAAPAGRP